MKFISSTMTISSNIILGASITTSKIAMVISALGERVKNRNSDFPPNDTWVDCSAYQTYCSEFEFRKYSPRFNPNLETFFRFYNDFEGLSRSFPCTLVGYKSVLHQSLIALSFFPSQNPLMTPWTKRNRLKLLENHLGKILVLY